MAERRWTLFECTISTFMVNGQKVTEGVLPTARGILWKLVLDETWVLGIGVLDVCPFYTIKQSLWRLLLSLPTALTHEIPTSVGSEMGNERKEMWVTHEESRWGREYLDCGRQCGFFACTKLSSWIKRSLRVCSYTVIALRTHGVLCGKLL